MSDLHQAALRGDKEEIRRLLDAGVPVDCPDGKERRTALMVACMSEAADLEMLQMLIDAGADVNATIPARPAVVDYSALLANKYLSEESRKKLEASQEMLKAYHAETPPLLNVVIGEISREKLRFLLERGADANAKSSLGYTAGYLATCAERFDLVDELIATGAAWDGVDYEGQPAIQLLSRDGRFGGIAQAFARGADLTPLKWNGVARAVALGSVEEVSASIEAGEDLEHADGWHRTPFLLAAYAGDIARASLLLKKGANRDAGGRTNQNALFYAVAPDHAVMVQWLLDQGLPVNGECDFKVTPLMKAAEAGSIASCRVLIAAGADVRHESKTAKSPIQHASDPEVIQLFLDHGATLSHLEPEVLRDFIGLGTAADLPVTREEFMAGRQRRFGTANPERMEDPFWKAMVRCGWDGYAAGNQFDFSSFGRKEPIWCHRRLGTSITPLPDGRFVQIAGEHEDSYDPDFCIYNEVIVHDGKGGFEILGYPEDVFPPTDFHSATLLGEWIYIIGSLGYYIARGDRMQVYRYHIESGRIERVETSGESPGWVHEHEAVLRDGRIRIWGGKIALRKEDGPSEIRDHGEAYWFDPATGIWELDPSSD